MKVVLLAAVSTIAVSTVSAYSDLKLTRDLEEKKEDDHVDTESICPLSCPFDVFYYYRDGGNYHENFIKDPPKNCVLAAIRNEDARAGAQYAIPPHKVAITQGYFPISDYLEDCSFDDSKTKEETVSHCGKHYYEYFRNYEDTDVVADYKCWVDIEYPIKSGLIVAAIGSDGVLRPSFSWNVGNSTEDPTAWDGAVYECCPSLKQVCTPEVPKEEEEEEEAARRQK